MFAQVLATEFLKLRRSKVTWATLFALSLGPLGLALFMWILRAPDRAKQLGLLGTKANLSGLSATWPAYASALTLIIGVGGMLLLSFIVAYVFGREYAESTAKNLLALPVARAAFVVAKLVVCAAWWAVLTLAVLAEGLVVGAALGLPGFSTAAVIGAIGDALLAAAISFLFAPVVAWVTVAARAYLAPVGFALAMMALGDLFSHTGWSPWFPWSIVPSLIGMVGTPTATLPAGSYVVVALTFVAGIAGTIMQVRLADEAG